MEDDKWSSAFYPTSSRSYNSAFRSLSDLCLDFEDEDGDNKYNNEYYEEEDDDDVRAEYPCPFCVEDFDLVELCCHIDDDHPFEPKPGICPVCATRVGIDMVRHLTIQHGNMIKRLQKLKLLKDDYYSSTLLKKDVKGGYFRSLLDVPQHVVSSSKTEPDPLLSFLNNGTAAEKPLNVQSHHSTDLALEKKSSSGSILERDVHRPFVSDKEQTERGRRSQFVQGLVSSVIFDDGL